MKRKTNLFYLSGDDSNFISFSNYSESLTGNILSTDWKLFPSKFLCLYIKLLDVDNHNLYIKRKERFIKYLMSYYENKLAFLRDYYINNDLNVEKNLLPLNYLLEALYRLPENYVDEKQKDSFDVYDPIFENARERLKTGGYFVMHLGKSDKCDMGEILRAKALRYFRRARLYSEDVTACEKFGIVDIGSVSEHQFLIME